MFVKIRLLGTIDETIQFCEQLRDAGASLIAIHARHRVNLVGRTGPGAREGAAKLEWVAQIRQAVRRSCGCQSPFLPLFVPP
jgi:tRNA-dihydrouridine synthase 1